MKTRKIAFYALIIPVAISQLLLFLFGEGSFSTSFTIIMFILAVWVFGLIIGVALSLIFKKSRKESWFYVAGQVVMYAAFSIFIWRKNISGNVEDIYTDNITHNHNIIDAFTEDQEWASIAFYNMESTLKDPN